MKSCLLAFITVITSIATGASASQIKGTPFTFAGSVDSTSAACPYPNKAPLAGYTLIHIKKEYFRNGSYKSVIAGPELIFSPGGAAKKITMKLDNIPDQTSLTSGKATIVLLPSTEILTGTYKGNVTVNQNGSFVLKYNLTLKTSKGTCSTAYTLSFARGLPKNLYDLL
jgi:hypothetical protein